MQDKPIEGDWKAFRRLVPELRERYVQGVNRDLRKMLSEEGASPTEQFWNLEERIRKESTLLGFCLDGHSRSKMQTFMRRLYQHGMLRDEDLTSFSAELRDRFEEIKDL